MTALSVTVLCPNGRRVNVKVTANTSILQIIEDACKKEGFDPDRYDLKHLRRVLDISSTVRYAGLPNKCQLELIKSEAPRTSGNVIVNIATDSGLRLVHEFPADTNLWDILMYHEQSGKLGSLLPSPGGDLEPVIVYTMRRISGKELRSTTLKALGLTGGKCMFRYSVQSMFSKSQAHVSAPLSRSKTSQQEDAQINSSAEQKQVRPQIVPQEAPHFVPQEQQQQHNLRVQQPPVQHAQQEQQWPVHRLVDVIPEQSPDLVSSSQSVVPDVVQSQNTSAQPDITDRGECMEPPIPMDLTEGHDIASSSSFSGKPALAPLVPEERVIKLGSHNAILFNMDDAPCTIITEEDDTFFQLSVNEIKKLYQEQQKILHEMEEAPLMTQQMRELEESSKVLSALNQYPVTHLRIYFPDNHVIQASFKPTDTIAAVINFIRPFLADPALEFSLYTRHPTRVLSADMTLVTADCVPNARLYFGCSVTTPPYFNDDTLLKKSSFSGAYNSLEQRKHRRQQQNASSEEFHTVSSNQASASIDKNEENHYKRTNISNQTSGAIPKVPKWFKTGK
ncbi:tether containing UBX domain for GLUT4 [Panulirus ornatus]|uniref:tether containing UBX domain for GLUT4 n=1 Tax=Panulirus ornatus TaxID=150431 RepID=UPI003A8BAB53